MNEQAQMFADTLSTAFNDLPPVTDSPLDWDQHIADLAMAGQLQDEWLFSTEEPDVPWTFEDTAPPAPLNCPF